MSKLINIKGKTFGNLKVISRAKNVGRRARWNCKCKCGTKKVVWSANMLSGLSRSCGCSKNKPGRINPNWKGYAGIGQRKYGEIQSGARRRNIPFSLSIMYLWRLFLNQNKLCALSGVPLEMNSNASLDRVDNNLGYSRGNVQWVHKDINYMKQDFSQIEFLNYCRLVTKTYEPKNKNW